MRNSVNFVVLGLLFVSVLVGGTARGGDTVAYETREGVPVLNGSIPASNRFSNTFFWEFHTSDLARSGFDDGDLHPFQQWPPAKYLADGKWAHARAGKYKGRRCLKIYWSRKSYDYWKDRNARIGKGIEVESPWKNGGFRSRKEVWYSFDLLVPDDGFPDHKKQGICQIFQITDGEDGSWASMLVIEDNKLLIRHRNPSKEKVAVERIPRDEWKTVILHTVASNEKNGTVELWYGGKKVYSATDINFGWGAEFTDEDRMVEDDFLFVKLGHYAFRSGNYDTGDERTLYYDNITNFNGQGADLSLRVEAENFRAGGAGNSYHDSTQKNQGGKYRRSEGVDIGVADDNNEGAYYVGWTKRGEWIDYTVDVPKDGEYKVQFRVASGKNGKIRMFIDDRGRRHDIDLPKTGGGQDWSTVDGPTVDLEAGRHIVRIGVMKGGFNLNWFEFRP